MSALDLGKEIEMERKRGAKEWRTCLLRTSLTAAATLPLKSTLFFSRSLSLSLFSRSPRNLKDPAASRWEKTNESSSANQERDGHAF